MQIPRPPFENDGVWLYGFGVSIHLIKTLYPEKRKLLKGRRLEHFEGALPNVDHVAFVTSDINSVETQLVDHNVFYKRVSEPHVEQAAGQSYLSRSHMVPGCGFCSSTANTWASTRSSFLTQVRLTHFTFVGLGSRAALTLHVPFSQYADANAIEISNCAPAVGEVTCKKGQQQREGHGYQEQLTAKSKL